MTSMSCFLSTTTEPGTREFVAGAADRGIRVLLPVTRTDGLLDWSVAHPGFDISEGMFGLPEPVGELLGPIAVNDVDLLVKQVRSQHAGDRVLIVNHALNVGKILKGFGHREEVVVARDDYEPLFVIVPRGEGPPLVLMLRL